MPISFGGHSDTIKRRRSNRRRFPECRKQNAHEAAAEHALDGIKTERRTAMGLLGRAGALGAQSSPSSRASTRNWFGPCCFA